MAWLLPGCDTILQFPYDCDHYEIKIRPKSTTGAVVKTLLLEAMGLTLTIYVLVRLLAFCVHISEPIVIVWFGGSYSFSSYNPVWPSSRPDSKCPYTVQFLDCSNVRLLGQFTPVLALYDPFDVDVPLNFDIIIIFVLWLGLFSSLCVCWGQWWRELPCWCICTPLVVEFRDAWILRSSPCTNTLWLPKISSSSTSITCLSWGNTGV